MSAFMGVVAAVYVPSMSLAFEKATPEPLVSADGGFLIPAEFVHEIKNQMDLYGNAFATIVRRKNKVVQMDWINPANVDRPSGVTASWFNVESAVT